MVEKGGFTLNGMVVPCSYKPIQADIAQLKKQSRGAVPMDGISHTKNILMDHLVYDRFDWVVEPVVYLWPHTFDNMVLQKGYNQEFLT